MVQELITEVE